MNRKRCISRNEKCYLLGYAGGHNEVLLLMVGVMAGGCLGRASRGVAELAAGCHRRPRHPLLPLAAAAVVGHNRHGEGQPAAAAPLRRRHSRRLPTLLTAHC